MRLATITLTAISLLLASAWAVIFTRPIQYALLAATPVAGEPLASRIQATDALLDYFAGRAPRPADLSARELAHLADVRSLMLGLHTATLLTLAALLAGGAWVWHRGRTSQLLAAVRQGAAVNAVAVASLLLILLIAFPLAFSAFHRLAFRNDLWQLPPGATLLRRYPTAYFAANAAAIVGLDLLLAVTLWRLTPKKKPPR